MICFPKSCFAQLCCCLEWNWNTKLYHTALNVIFETRFLIPRQPVGHDQKSLWPILLGTKPIILAFTAIFLFLLSQHSLFFFLTSFHTHLTIMGRWQNNGLAICSPLIHIQVICSHNVNCTHPPPPPACYASSLTLGKAIRSFTHLRLYEMKHYGSTLMCCYLVFEAWSPQKTQWSQQRLQCWEFVTLDIVMLGV